MRRRLLSLFLRLLVLIIAVAVYLLLLPIQIKSNDPGLSISFPLFLRGEGNTFSNDPIYWNYILLLPIVLVIILVGFELIRLFERKK